ncbi:41386_t:CDS:1, partial [Gigaspora margarita]
MIFSHTNALDDNCFIKVKDAFFLNSRSNYYKVQQQDNNAHIKIQSNVTVDKDPSNSKCLYSKAVWDYNSSTKSQSSKIEHNWINIVKRRVAEAQREKRTDDFNIEEWGYNKIIAAFDNEQTLIDLIRHKIQYHNISYLMPKAN